MKLSKELLKEIYDFVDANLKAKIENEVPEMKPTLEEWKWYRHKNCNTLVFFQGLDVETYGFYHPKKSEPIFEVCNNWSTDVDVWQLATREEVGTALVNEAKRKYKGKKVKCIHFGESLVNFDNLEKIKYHDDGCLRLYADNRCICIFDNGTWATIINEPTEKELLIEKANKVEAELIELKKEINKLS
jgi:hypothetical protein